MNTNVLVIGVSVLTNVRRLDDSDDTGAHQLPRRQRREAVVFSEKLEFHKASLLFCSALSYFKLCVFSYA